MFGDLKGDFDLVFAVVFDHRRDGRLQIPLVRIELAQLLRAFAQVAVVQQRSVHHGNLLGELRGGKFRVSLKQHPGHARLEPQLESDFHLIVRQALHLGHHVREIAGVEEPLHILVEDLLLELRSGTELDVEPQLLRRQLLNPLLVEFDVGHLRRESGSRRQYQSDRRAAP